MTEHKEWSPITFGGHSVYAIHASLKDMTRRVIEPQPEHPCSHAYENAEEGWWTFGDNTGRIWRPAHPKGAHRYIREAVRITLVTHRRFASGTRAQISFEYVADARRRNRMVRVTPTVAKLKPGNSMQRRSPPYVPRWCARTGIEIVGVRAERLCDISEEDSLREGIIRFDYTAGELSPYCPMSPERAREIEAHAYGIDKLALGVMSNTARQAFLRYWDNLHYRDRPWAISDKNPWVWVYEFKVIETDLRLEAA
jgi:hypothetical protein